MTRLALGLVPALAAALVAALPADAPGCAPAPRRGESVYTLDEGALVVWDAKEKVEHFVRRAHFVSTGYDIGFLVPTPNRPFLDVADDHLFSALAGVTAARVEYRTQVVYHDRDLSFGCAGDARMAPGSAAGEKAAPAARGGGVSVLEQKRVGDFDAAVLAFRKGDGDTGGPEEGAKALAEWLQKHGYESSPAIQKWLEWYVTHGWCVTAFKIAAAERPDVPPVPPGAAAGRSRIDLRAKPVRMSFRTERPFYPYREPQPEGAPAGDGRKLRVFVAADKRYEGKLGDGSKPWPGRTVWAGTPGGTGLTNAFGYASGANGKKGTDDAPAAKSPFAFPAAGANWYLTEFEDASFPRPGTDEVYFEPAADQSPVERPVEYVTTTQYVSRTPWWHFAVYAGLPLTALLIGLGAWRVSGLFHKHS